MATTPLTLRTSVRSVSLLIACAAPLGLCACAAKSESPVDMTVTERSVYPPASEMRKATRKEQLAELSEAAAAAQAMFDQIDETGALDIDSSAPAPSSARGAPLESPGSKPIRSAGRPGKAIITPSIADLPSDALGQAVSHELAATDKPAPGDTKAALAKPERTPAQKRADALTELAAQLKPDLGAVNEPMRSAIPLIALDTIDPGSGSAELAKLTAAVKSPEEARAINALRDLAKSLNTSDKADPAALARTLREHADKLSGGVESTDALGLGAVALCQRVESFGRFTPLPGTKFLAGRPAAAVLYTEIENFFQRPADGSAATNANWIVEVGQELQLILDSDGSRQWQHAEQVVRDLSRSKRGDYFLVQRIELPRNLSVGKYTLKVIVRDKGNGAETERNIPIQIVADANLLGSAAR